jgi:isoquinoline 1-oxidoreductase
MSDGPFIDLEVERYELNEPAPYEFEPFSVDVDRRDFLRLFGVMGGGLIVAASLRLEAQQESGRGGGGQAAAGDLEAWIHIDGKGRVTAFTGKVEIGQNARTSLSQVVADELRIPIADVSMIMADTDLTPFDQGTFGSRTTPAMAPLVARAAGTAREMLIDLAAERWKADRASLTVDAGRVRDAGGRTIGFGELTAGKRLTGRVTANPETVDRWKLRGTSIKKVDGPAIVTGAHTFTPDLVRPNMAFGVIVRPPVYGATPQAVDDSGTRAVPGVRVVRDGNLIGVIGPSTRVVRRAAASTDSRKSISQLIPSKAQTSAQPVPRTPLPCLPRRTAGDCCTRRISTWKSWW